MVDTGELRVWSTHWLSGLESQVWRSTVGYDARHDFLRHADAEPSSSAN